MIKEIVREIQAIKDRNRKVELDKAWETSWTRIISIALMTYVVIVIFFLVIKLPNPFLSALVPSLAFIISTLTLPFIKKIWIRGKK